MNKCYYILILLTLQIDSVAQITLPDSNFIKCLKTNFPSSVNAGNKLVVTEAAKARGTLTCTEGSVKSAEGLQYFTGLTTIKLLKNSITYLPSLSAISNLQQIDVSENQLEVLPEFTGLKKLKIIYAHRNKLKVFPSISTNDSLTTLYVHTNQFDTIPDLSHLKQLITLHLSYNNLQYLPGIDKLTSLQNLNCWKNQLREVPSLADLKNLDFVDLSYNELTRTPELGLKPKLTVAYFNDNRITTLTDFSQCPKLINVRLYGNPITFREILKLTAVQGYDTLFKLLPNFPFKVGKKILVNQLQKLMLFTGIDQNVPNTTYDWYRNGTLLYSGVKDTLVLEKATWSDSGNYYCQIRNSFFPNVILKTDNFSVKILPCLDPRNLSFYTTEINCLSQGSISINGYNQTENLLTYELMPSGGGKPVISTTGRFEGLSENSYKVKINIQNGCSYIHPETIILTQKDCEEVLISPDNDGTADSHYFADTGKVIIYDKRGLIIKTMAIPAEWDGTTDKGKVFSGFYVADINSGKKLIGITVLY